MDVYASLNDPVFWVHHTRLDYMLALWQKRDKTWLPDIGGFRTGEGTGLGPGEAEHTTLGTSLGMGLMNKDVLVKAVINTVDEDGKGVLCYV